MSGSNDIGEWYYSIPRFTRLWFTGSVIIPLTSRFGLIHPYNLVLLVKPIIERLQV